MADFRPAPKPKTALDSRKLNLTAPCPTAPDKTSALVVGVYASEKFGEPNPRLTVFTRDPEDQGERNDYGKIRAELDPVVFFAFLEKLEEIANGPAGQENKVKLENKNFTFFGGKRSDAPQVTSEIHFGKDVDGIVWLSVLKKDRPRIKFPFGPNNFHTLFHPTGEQFSRGEASALWARAWVKLMREMIPPFLISEYKEVPYEPKGGGQGGGNRGGYNNGGNRGGYGGGNGGGGQQQQRQAATVDAGSDDDIPW
jgi:hypothetical protein